MSGLVEKLSRRVQLMIGRCVIKAATASGGRVLVTVDALEGETLDGVELAEPYGLTSVPVAGTEGVMLSVMSVRGHPVVIPLGNRSHRPRDLKQGESALFDGAGHQVEIREDRVRIIAPDTIEISAPTVTVNGEPVARITDLVEVGAGSSAGLWPIVTGAEPGGGAP